MLLGEARAPELVQPARNRGQRFERLTGRTQQCIHLQRGEIVYHDSDHEDYAGMVMSARNMVETGLMFRNPLTLGEGFG